jgi:uncharacterized protein
MSSPVTWFEITSPDHASLRDFYGDLFGWQLQPVEGMDYALVAAGDGGIGGGIAGSDGQNQVVFYIQVDDPQAILDQIEARGGKTVVPVTVVPDMVTFAQFADPSGNVVGLVKA